MLELAKVGPMLGARRELRAPGVPLFCGTTNSVVRATRLN